ncbi:MAG: hypothetical protein V4492_08665 [Chlamydiota bacterium]
MSSIRALIAAILIFFVTHLNASASHIDHLGHFDALFRHHKVDALLEFGLGHGTKALLERCGHVTSVELLLSHQTREWADQTAELCRGYHNWNLVVQRAPPSFDSADRYSREWYDPSRFDSMYRLDLKRICDELFSQKNYDVGFVDPGFHFRGDVVKELFDRVPIIVAHDTSSAHDIYGWNRIYTPSNYERIEFPEGQGTTMWIDKKLKGLIEALTGRPQVETPHRKLRVFFPMIHYALADSLARALAYAGHTLVLPGNSFIEGFGFFEWLCHAGIFHAHVSPISKFVEVLEVNQLYTSPPDVFIANCEFTEGPIFAVVNFLRDKAIANPAIVHLCGNNNTSFSKDKVEHLVAIDAYTPLQYDPQKVDILRWVPWIDFESVPFKGVSDQLVLNNFLTHFHEANYQISGRIFHENAALIQRDFPYVFIRSPPYCDRALIFDMIDDSCATLHIKELEGFGYAIVENISKGRPVILRRSFSHGMRLMNWCIEGKTAIFFEDYAELEQKLRPYLENAEYRHAFQKSCAETIRFLWNNEQQARMLDALLQKAVAKRKPIDRSSKDKLFRLYDEKVRSRI